MNDDNEKQDDCTIDAMDPTGNPNLCCCYAVEPDGTYVDPCYQPVDACCCYEPACR